MKLFISADIEGCAGVALTDETHKKESVYQRFAEEMTEEVVAACEAAHEAGADEIVVKDGHGDASNIDPLKMPEYVTLIRGKSGHPYNMMYMASTTAMTAYCILATMHRQEIRIFRSATHRQETACIFI